MNQRTQCTLGSSVGGECSMSFNNIIIYAYLSPALMDFIVNVLNLW